jgi:hypothetical protein
MEKTVWHNFPTCCWIHLSMDPRGERPLKGQYSNRGRCPRKEC